MKKLIYIKETFLMVTFVTAFLLFAAFSNNQNPKDTKAVAEEQNKATFDNKKQRNDAQFLVNAAEINLELIQLSQLAQQKGRTSDVKELGKMIEDAHTKSQKDLTALAKVKRISIPSSLTDDSRDAYEDLNEKSRDDFDQAYVNMMVSKHRNAISKFEDAANDSHDSDIKNWARATLPHLRTHHDRSIESQKKFADMYFEKKDKKDKKDGPTRR